MFYDIDLTKKPQKPQIFLCKPDISRTILSKLNESYNTEHSVKLGQINELTLNIPLYLDKDHKLEINKNINIIKNRYLLKIVLGTNVEYYIINKITDTVDDNIDYKTINAFSLAYELKDKLLRQYKVTSYNVTQVLRDILSNTIWGIGNIDVEFNTQYRSFDVNSQTVLDFIIQVAETFNAIIEWDTENRLINFVKSDNIGKDLGLKISYSKYLKTMSKELNSDEMVTRFKVFGANDMSIQTINPTGANYLEDFSYFLNPFSRNEDGSVLTHSDYMSDSLCNSILDYNLLLITKRGIYFNLLNQLNTFKENLTIKEKELTNLNDQLAIILDKIDSANANNQSTTQLIIDKTNKNIEIGTKQNEVNAINSTITSIQNQISELQDSLSIENNFTPQQIYERNQFIIEKEWTDTNYTNAQDLYNTAVKRFEDLKNPQTVISIDIVNFLEIIEEQHNWDKLNLGDTIYIKYDNFNIDVTAKIIEIQYNYEDGNINLTIANIKDYLNNEKKLLKMLYNSVSTSSEIDINRYKWGGIDDTNNSLNKVIDILQGNIKNEINLNVNETVDISKRGIRVHDINDPNKYIVLQHGVIALTQDGGNSWKTAMTPDKIVADVIMGKLLCGINLQIDASDEEGNKFFTVDQNGVNITNLILSLLRTDNKTKILMDANSGMKIQKNTGTELTPVWEDVLYINNNGDLVTKGNIIIGEGNSVFHVDELGLYLGSDTFEDAPFRIDLNGNMVSNNADFTGELKVDGVNILDEIEGIKTINGQYLTDNSINNAKIIDLIADKISAGTITGSTIKTGETGSTRVELRSTYADIDMYRGSNNILRIEDDVDASSIYSPANLPITIGRENGNIYAAGDWNFVDANVTGIVARFG